MSNFSAIFVRLTEEPEQEFDEVNATLKQQGFLFTLRYHAAKPWVQLRVEEPENVAYYTQTISKIFPDRRVIGISCQSVVDAIGYWDMTNGQETRVLEYRFYQERTWEKAEGALQEWEKAVFGGRDGYQGGGNPEIGQTLPPFSNSDLMKVGDILQLHGFGTPGYGEQWTKEVIN